MKLLESNIILITLLHIYVIKKDNSIHLWSAGLQPDTATIGGRTRRGVSPTVSSVQMEWTWVPNITEVKMRKRRPSKQRRMRRMTVAGGEKVLHSIGMRDGGGGGGWHDGRIGRSTHTHTHTLVHFYMRETPHKGLILHSSLNGSLTSYKPLKCLRNSQEKFGGKKNDENDERCVSSYLKSEHGST